MLLGLVCQRRMGIWNIWFIRRVWTRSKVLPKSKVQGGGVQVKCQVAQLCTAENKQKLRLWIVYLRNCKNYLTPNLPRRERSLCAQLKCDITTTYWNWYITSFTSHHVDRVMAMLIPKIATHTTFGCFDGILLNHSNCLFYFRQYYSIFNYTMYPQRQHNCRLVNKYLAYL